MTISSSTSRNNYTGNGAVATYAYTFPIFAETDLLITVKDLSDVETTLVLTTDYTVTGVGASNGGNVVLVDASQAWLDGDGDLLTSFVLAIRRVIPLTQGTDIRNQGDFYPEAHEDQFDRCISIDQQQQDELDRSVKLPETVDPADFTAEIPAAIVGTENVTIMTNTAGTAFVVGPTTGDLVDAETNATAAAASAAAAAISETAAAASAVTAANAASASQWVDVVYLTDSDSPVAIADADSGNLYSVDCTSGNVVINLPGISGLTLGAPWVIGIKKTDSSSNTITVNRDGTDTIDGATSSVIDRQDSGRNFIPDTDGTPDDWTTIEFGSVPIDGAIVGTTDAQVLTNKTVDDALITQDISTPANPASGYKKIYAKTAGFYVLNSAGTETALAGTLTKITTYLQMSNATGHGSTGTRVIKFGTTDSDIGSDVTYASDATNGDTFTIVTTGLYHTHLQVAYASTDQSFGISVNASSTTTNIQSLAESEIGFESNTGGTAGQDVASKSIYLTAGDVVRVHDQATGIGTATKFKFAISNQRYTLT